MSTKFHTVQECVAFREAVKAQIQELRTALVDEGRYLKSGTNPTIWPAICEIAHSNLMRPEDLLDIVQS